MALAQEDIEQIQMLIKNSIAATPEVGNANVRYELDIRERIYRVEEELKHQRELMLKGFEQSERRFEQVDKRFEQMAEESSRRFEQVDKNFKQMAEESNRRFEQVDKRFEQMAEESNRRFEQVDKKLAQMAEESNRRFEQVEKRFEQVDKRFEKIDKQLEIQTQTMISIQQEIRTQMRWSFGMLIGIGGIVVTILKLTGG
ncbi:MAG: hypothetical protein PSN04_07995 [Methyloprofundus sp.]|nr:hypothetical protein [Methyloprofundus sp.]